MASRINTFYASHNKIIKLEGPNKSMMIGDWNKSLEQLLRTTEPTMTSRGLLNYYPHCNNVLFKALFPDAAGPNPPEKIKLVPFPKEIPQVPFDATLNAHKLREFQNEPFIKYTSAMLKVWHEVIGSFDDEIFSHLKTMAGSNNILDLDLVSINGYINGPTFAIKTDKNVEAYMQVIKSPLDLTKTLQQNFDQVELGWNILKREAPSRSPTSNALFAIMRTKL